MILANKSIRPIAIASAIAISICQPLGAVTPATKVKDAASDETISAEIERLRIEDYTAWQAGDYDRAATASARVLALVARYSGEKSTDYARALDDHAVNLKAAGNAALAEPLNRQALAMRIEQLGERHPETLTSYHNLATTLGSLGRADEAASINTRVLEMRTGVLGEKHSATLATLNNLAGNLRDLGRADEAVVLDRRGLVLSVETMGEKHPETLISMNNLAMSLRDLGQTEEAEQIDRRTLALRFEVLGEKHPGTLNSLNNLAASLSALGRAAEAEPLDRRAWMLRTEVLGEKHPTTLSSLSNLALTLVALNRFSEAEPLNRQALALRRETLGEKHPDTLISAGNLALNLHFLGRVAEAEVLDRQALSNSLSVLGEKHPRTLSIMGNLASDWRELGRAADAEALDSLVLAYRKEKLGEKHPDTLAALGNLGFGQLAQPGRAHLALSSFRRAVALLRDRTISGGNEVRRTDQRERELSAGRGYYGFFADAAWAAGPGLQTPGLTATATPPDKTALKRLRAEVFAALQDMQAGSTSQAVALQAANRIAESNGVGELARQRQRLTEEWRTVESQLNRILASDGADASARRARFDARLGQIDADIAAIDAQLAVRSPKYFAIIRPQPLSQKTVQKLLRPDEAVLQIVPTRYGTHLMVVTRQGLTWHRSDLAIGQVDAMVAKLRAQLDPAGSETQGSPGFDRNTANKLYAGLISPIHAAIEGHTHLYIAATGSLASLPFGVLVTEPPLAKSDDEDPETLRHTPWFADAHALIQIPSLQSLGYLRSGNQRKRQAGAQQARFVGFGDPLLGGKTSIRGARGTGSAPLIEPLSLIGEVISEAATPLMDPARLRRLSRLAGTARELEAMQTMFDTPNFKLYLQDAMTESAIRSADLSATSILHLATHGLTAAESGAMGRAEPGLVFTPPAKASSGDDGYLAASEVLSIDLSATQWVILSACNTAAPANSGEASLSGLARTFFYAGAPTLLISHWPVYDDIAAEMTVETLRRAQKPGVSRAQGLQAAMRAIRNDPAKEAEHPSFWAPFSLVGDGR